MSDALTSSTARRGFVGRLIAGAAAAAGGAFLSRDLSALPLSSSAPSDATVNAEWDMSWVDRVTGKYRQVFDSPEIVQGTALTQTRTWMNGYAEVYGAKPADMSGVLVIRHAAIYMILNDAMWDELDLGNALAAKTPGPAGMTSTPLRDPVSGEPARRNPFLTSNIGSGAKYAMLNYPNGGFDSLMADGVIVLGCDLALRRPIAMIMKAEKVDNATARARVLANILPGVIIMPSGIFATARAQEAGCTFMQA